MTLRRLAPVLCVAAMLAATPTTPRAGEVGVRQDRLDGVTRIFLEGNYVGSRYAVERSNTAFSPGVSVGERFALCTGDCVVVDTDALVGATYFYTFDVVDRDGFPKKYGPFEVTIGGRAATGLSAALSPNPLRERGTVKITAALPLGARATSTASAIGLPGEVTLIDTSGRTLRTLWRGTLDRLVFDVPFSTRDEHGNRLAAGLYFLVLKVNEQRTITRVAVVR